MIEPKQVTRNWCTCWCGHQWWSDEVPDRCAGKGKHRDWNSRDPRPAKIPVSKSEPEIDPFSELEVVPENVPQKPKSSGSKIAEELLAKMASKLGRPAHAPNCSCFTCKPPREK